MLHNLTILRFVRSTFGSWFLNVLRIFWAQINLYMLFNQHDFTATLCISLTSLDYF